MHFQPYLPMPPLDQAEESPHCPLPSSGEARITLGHGSGGVLSAQLLENGVFRLLDNPLLSRRHDGAMLPPSAAGLAFTTDSFVVSPLFFPGGDIGSLAVHGTVNDLAMCGAIPEYLSLAFILEEGLPIATFYEILESIRKAAGGAGVQVVTGDTKVVERGKGDQLFVNTSGVGRIHPKADIGADRVRPGDAVLLSGPIASHGMAVLSVREGLAFESDIVSDSVPLAGTVRALLDRFGEQVRFLRDPTRGGLGAALSELARDSRLGIRLQESTLPILPSVSAACELLGLDPLFVANEGVFLAVVPAEIAADCCTFLRTLPFAAAAAVVGELTDDHPGRLLLRTRTGGTRVIHPPVGEQLPRIC